MGNSITCSINCNYWVYKNNNDDKSYSTLWALPSCLGSRNCGYKRRMSDMSHCVLGDRYQNFRETLYCFLSWTCRQQNPLKLHDVTSHENAVLLHLQCSPKVNMWNMSWVSWIQSTSLRSSRCVVLLSCACGMCMHTHIFSDLYLMRTLISIFLFYYKWKHSKVTPVFSREQRQHTK
jgi:hypothetical protein